jgi:dephospho-CoA kinase
VLIALTGGIGSGKSTVAQRWVELGATEVDADQLAREVVEPGQPALTEIAATFGHEVLNEDGTLNRGKLAEAAFADSGARLALEAILHPRIQDLAQSRTAGLGGIVVYTIPLLAETDSKLRFDKVVTVSCDESVRIARLVASRGMTAEQAMARVRAQATDADREARADVVIDSNCSLEELMFRAETVFRGFTTK